VPSRNQPFVNGSLTGADIADNSLGGDDINESRLARVPDAGKLGGIPATGFVQGRGQSLADRDVFLPNFSRVAFLAIPGLGTIEASCTNFSTPVSATLHFVNDSGGPVDFWNLAGGTSSSPFGIGDNTVLVHEHNDSTGSRKPVAMFSVGKGGLGTPRRMATVMVTAAVATSPNRCGFQAHGTLWTSG
jgi:hypothetical protein